MAVTKISADRGFPDSCVVAFLIGKGFQVEYDAGRLELDRPKWSNPPENPRYAQAGLSRNEFFELIGIAESLFEPLNVAASALFQLGLREYLETEAGTNG